MMRTENDYRTGVGLGVATACREMVNALRDDVSELLLVHIDVRLWDRARDRLGRIHTAHNMAQSRPAAGHLYYSIAGAILGGHA